MTSTPEPVTAVRSAKQFLTYVASGSFQCAVAEALARPDAYFEAFRRDMQTKRDTLAAGPAEAGFEVHDTAGTYFISTDSRPNAVFYDHREAGAPFVRFAFCKRAEVPKEAAERLRRLAQPPWRRAWHTPGFTSAEPGMGNSLPNSCFLCTFCEALRERARGTCA